MRVEPELATVINNVGTMAIIVFLIDRGYRLAIRWLELRWEVDLTGPDPVSIRGSRLVRSAGAPSIRPPEGSTS